MSTVNNHSNLSSIMFNFKKDYYQAFDGSNHIIVWKRFPTCCFKDKPEDFQKFFLRFYLPKRVVANSAGKIERIMIMINGINEVDDVAVYDKLGEKFAEFNMASVLMALPDHLYRHPKHRGKNKEARPSDDLFNETYGPKNAIQGYLQIMEEIDILLSHLKNQPCKCEENDFFHNLFSPDTRISILGYSMGASVALVSFVCNLRKYNTCFILNGGIQLDDLHTGRLFHAYSGPNRPVIPEQVVH